jgi:hypothetical protein
VALIIIGVAAFVLVVLITGVFVVSRVVAGKAEPVAGSTAAAGQPGQDTGRAPAPTNTPAAPATTGAANPAKYGHLRSADICKLDISALGRYAATTTKTLPYDGSQSFLNKNACEFDLKSASGQYVILDINADTYTDPQDAQSWYQQQAYSQDQLNGSFDADLAGIGQRAYGKGKDPDDTNKDSKYTVRVVDSNVFLEVSLDVFADSVIPKNTLKAIVVNETTYVIGTLPRR